MKRVLSFILISILILNTAITPEISARAYTAVEAMAGGGMQAAGNGSSVVMQEDGKNSITRTAAMSRADKILGLEEYDEHGISESDADIYDYQMDLKYPASYLVEAAEKRFGFTGLMTVVNKFNNEEFRLHPEYYYEAALMSLLFEQAGDTAFLEGNQQDVLTESSQVAGSLLGFAVGQETEALEELKKKAPDAFTEQDYLDNLKGIKKIEDGAEILGIILDYAKDAYDVILYAKNLEKILSLQEETITFLAEMKNRTDNEDIEQAINTVLSVYKQNQQRPEDLINFIIQMDSASMAFEKLAWDALELTWNVICMGVPILKIVDLALGIEGFVLEYAFATDAISDAYAKMEAIYQLENIAREIVKDLGKKYINDRAVDAGGIADLAEVFNVGWDFFTVLLDADCQASLLFAKATFNAGVADFDIWALFSGSGGYDEFAGYIKNYQGTIARWKNNINLYMEGLKPENRKVDGATFREDSVEMEPGDTYILNMDLLPEDAVDKYVRYGIVSGDRPSGDTGLVAGNDVVKIEGNKLIALAEGTVEIEGLAGDVGMRDTMIVHVGNDDMVTSDGLLYRIEDGQRVIITGYEGNASKVEIPAYIGSLPVAEIETFTGKNGRNITVKEVILPSSVTRIWDYAFYQCVSLKKINLEKVTLVGEYAFAYCSALESVVFQNYQFQANLRQYAFAYCTSLQSINLLTAMPAIPEGLCYGCISLKKVIFPENLWRIHEKAFYNCGFEELYLPKWIMFLDDSCISHCENLKKFYIPDSYLVVPDNPEQFINAEDTVHYVVEGSAIHSILKKWNSEGYEFKIALVEKYPDGSEDSDSSDSGDSGDGQNDGQSGSGSTGSGTSGNATNSSVPSNGDSLSSPSSNTGHKGEAVIKAKIIKKAKKSKKIKTATVGKSVQLKVKLSPANTTEEPVWTSSKPKVATVSPDGKVTPKKKGKTKITARIANGKKVTWKIKVKELKAKKISLNKKKVTLHTGETLRLKTKLKPKGSTAKIKWKSSKKKVASVSKNGTVTTRKKGKAIITAQLPNGKKAKCKITVKKAVPQDGGSTGGNKNNSGNTGSSNGQNHTSGNSNSSNTSGGGSAVTQPGGDTGNQPGGNPGGGSGTSSDNQSPGDSGNPNPDDSDTPGGESSDDEKVPTKLTLAADHLTLKGRWQAITLSAGEETEVNVGDELEIIAEPDSFYGDSQILDAEITEGNDMQRIHWSSADETVVKVYNGGLIRGVRTGTTTVTATTTDGTTAECQVTVEDADLQWESSDTEVAEISSVDSDGRTAYITTGKEGAADIIVCSGSYQSTCRLTVSADSTDPEQPTEPTDSTDSTEPTEPTDPTDSTEPTEPTNPTDSTEPTEPTDPTDSTEPTEPTDPDDSDDPDNPDAKPISTKEDLKAIANDLDGDYILTKDIDISGENWTPIGTIEEPFTGTLDGNGHTISGLTIEKELYMENEEYYIGLFGVLQGGSHTNAVTISDLTLEGTIVLRGGQGIDNEELELWLQAGALAAEVNWAIFDNCTNRVNITADFSMTQDTDDMNLYVGGMVGGCNDNSHMYFKQCTNEGKINVKVNGGEEIMAYTGGLIGRGVADIAIQECTNKGNITVSTKTSDVEGGQTVVTYTGGMAGDLIIADLVDCMNHADIHCYAEIKEKPEFSPSGEYCLAGGMAGKERAGITKENLQNTGNVSAESPNEEMTVLYGELFGYPAE